MSFVHRALHARLLGLGLCLGICVALTGCARTPAQMPQPGPPTVTITNPLERDVTDDEQYTGRTAAVDAVQILARVTGYLEKINFKDGADVEQADVLYEIDPRPYQAQYDAAVAQLAQSEANLKLARANNERFQSLAKEQPGAVTPQQLDQYQSQEEQAIAAVNLARANRESAKLNLGWTKVTAPISGQLSRTLVTQGNLVVADQTVLTNIVSQDPMYAYFDVDEPTMLRVQQLIREGKFKSAREPGVRVPVYLGLASERDYPHEGYVDFINNQVDPATATLQIRGIIPNPKPPVGYRLLSPGLFVRIRVPIGPPYPAILLLEEAIGTDQDLKFVYVVDDQNKVLRHDVTLGTVHDGLVGVKEGLKAGERVIINGLQKVRPGMVVQPQLVPMS